MTQPALTLEQLSTLDQETFTSMLGSIFEHSPWVAEQTWPHRPFTSIDALHACMVAQVDQAPSAQQLSLINAHPELAGRLAAEGKLTRASTAEQQGAGLDQCSAQELAQLNELNRLYRDKFGIPFIIAVKGLDRHQIIQAMQQRLSGTPQQAIDESLAQIARIAAFRLHELFDTPAHPFTLKAQVLDATAFKPFGEVIEASDHAHHFFINDGTTKRYHDLAKLQPGHDGHMIVSLFRSIPRLLPIPIHMMERHPHGSQAFIPVSGKPWLTVVANTPGTPQPSDLHLFWCAPNQGVNYAPGVWHHPLLALDAISDFIVLDRSGPGDNCDVCTLDHEARILASSLP